MAIAIKYTNLKQNMEDKPMKKTKLVMLVLIFTFLAMYVQPVVAEGTLYKDGTFNGTGNGIGGEVLVSVTIVKGKIESVTVKSHSETPGLSDPAIKNIPAKIVETQSTDVDNIAGATITSDAIKDAVNKALKVAAGFDVSEDKVVLPFEQADVLVVGAGMAGLNAAYEAASLGANVILFEQNSRVGGSGLYAGGTLSGAGTKVQHENNIVDTPDKFYADIERLGKGIFIPELTRYHVENAAKAIDWYDVIGVSFGDRKLYQPAVYEAFDTLREIRVEGGASAIVNKLEALIDEKVQEGKLALLLNTKVVDIVLEDGAVIGVVAKDKEGNLTTYNAKSTILATGGYGHNEEWVKRYNFKNSRTDAPAFATGDGYDFAEKAGAMFSNMDYLPAYPGAVPVNDGVYAKTMVANTTKYPGAIWINLNGERMIDEIDCSPAPKQAVWSEAPENIVYIVFDESMKKSNPPILSYGAGFAMKQDAGWVRFDEEIQKSDVVFQGATIEELAAKTGINKDNLVDTINKYNKFVENGKDTDYGRVNSLVKFGKGPYYAVKTVPYLMLTKGGPLMDTNAQIINKEGQPIVGLYQCGELVGGANIGGAASIGGLANTICVLWGKTAAKSAVDFALSK